MNPGGGKENLLDFFRKVLPFAKRGEEKVQGRIL